MQREKVKLPKITREEWRVLRSLTVLEEGLDEFTTTQRMEEFYHRNYKAMIPVDLKGLVARKLLEEMDGAYRTTSMGFRSEWAWTYVYSGISVRTAENFKLPTPEGLAFYDYFKITEEQLGTLFDIVTDEEAIEWWSQPVPDEEDED